MSSVVWAILSFLIVVATKYITSIRLRSLREKIQKDQQDANELRRVLSQASEKEGELKAENEELQAKVTALRNIILTLERTHQRALQNRAQSDDAQKK